MSATAPEPKGGTAMHEPKHRAEGEPKAPFLVVAYAPRHRGPYDERDDGPDLSIADILAPFRRGLVPPEFR